MIDADMLSYARDQLAKFSDRGKVVTLWGVPVTEFDRDELIAAIGFLDFSYEVRMCKLSDELRGPGQ